MQPIGHVFIGEPVKDIPADAVMLTADDQRGLAMGLEPDDLVDDVDARLLEHAGLVDIALLVNCNKTSAYGNDDPKAGFSGRVLKPTGKAAMSSRVERGSQVSTGEAASSETIDCRRTSSSFLPDGRHFLFWVQAAK